MAARRSVLITLAYAAAVALGIIGATLASAPAGLFAWTVARASGGAATLTDVAGSFWSGSGDLTLRTPQGPLTLPGFTWTLHAGALWRGTLSADLAAPGPGISGTAEVGASPSALWIGNAEFRVPADQLARQVPSLASLGASGRLTLRTGGMRFGRSRIDGSAELQVQDVRAVRLGALGDYRAELEGAGDHADVRVATLRGPLRITGNGELSRTGDFRFRGEASADPAGRNELAPVLLLIGVPRADGSVPLLWPLSGPPLRSAEPRSGPVPMNVVPAPAGSRGGIGGIDG